MTVQKLPILDREPLAVLAAVRPGEGRKVVCPFCLEALGWCAVTGGPNPCEGEDEHAAALVDATNTPAVHIRLSPGGAR